MFPAPTKTGTSHPAIGDRDLLGEQIEALHRAGIRAPIYTTIVWEEDVAAKHPEWRQMTQEGHFAGWALGPGKPGHVGTWRFNNPLDPRYQDYLEAHIREICERYGPDVDGFFFDILFFAPDACWSDASIAFREKRSLMGADAATSARFQGAAQAAFAKRFTRLVKSLSPDASVFYNAQNEGNMDPGVGPCARAQFQTHCEIESLPSGFWGYYHFPRMARAQSTWGKPWLGTTGRFQKMWGDFGGIKPQPALEFECFRAQAMGGANSVGDQLPPRGTLDPAAYDLIGAVYQKWQAAESFYAHSKVIPAEIGIFSASSPGFDGGVSEEGAILLCEEAHYDCCMLDGLDSPDGHGVVILTDSTVVTPDLAKVLKKFHAKGGQLVLSHRAGFDASGCWALDFLPLSFFGETKKFPTYWRARRSFDQPMSVSDRVFYDAGMQVKVAGGVRVLVDRVLPYFKRTAVTFSSHFQTPPVSRADRYPAVIGGDNFVYFADPIFREYRRTGNLAVRDVFRRTLRDFTGGPQFGDGLPTTVQVFPRRRGRDLLLTLLHYIPVRKAMYIDIIEEGSTFSGEVLRLKHPVSRVRDFTTGEDLVCDEDGGFLLPPVKGRLLLEVQDYFHGVEHARGTPG